jgi:hypothetical protein
MKTKLGILRLLMMLMLSAIASGALAQNQDPTQTVCLSTQNYYVDPGDAGNTFLWTISPGVSGTDWTITSPTAFNTDIVWLNAGTYTVTLTETDISTTCESVVTVEVTVLDPPTATISYSGSPYCATGTATVTQTGQGGGTYSSTAGLVINATTGEIDLAASTPATYTVTYSFTNGTCSDITTASVTINALPTATISYSGSPYCATGTATVTQTGQGGGTYSSTAGLVINATTGDIDLAASTPGTYTVTYSFTNGTCPNTTTAGVTINPLPATSPIWHN